MKTLFELLKKLFSTKSPCFEAYILEKEFTVPTLQRSRDGYKFMGC